MISFEPTEDQQLVVETVSELARATFAPKAREFEAAGAVADDARRAVRELGLALAHVPEALGGQGLGLLTSCMINEELAFGDAAVPFDLPGFGSFVIAAQELCAAERAKELIAPVGAADGDEHAGAVAWSEPAPNRERAGFRTVAQRSGDGWEISGQKSFVAHAARADRFIVFAQVDTAAGWGGIGAFLIAKGAQGLSVGARHVTLGLDAASFSEVTLDKVLVSDADRLQPAGDFVRATLRFFAKYALLVAARQVGLSRSAFTIARDYADIRKAFGKPIGHFQAVAFTLADRHMDAESARALVQRAAWAWDAGKSETQCLLWTAEAVAHAHEVAMRCADDCVQLHGGAGFIRDLIAEKLMRDAKQMALCGCTAEQMDQLAAALELGAALDPAVVLPTPDTQAVFT